MPENVLIPVLSFKENEQEFIDKALQGFRSAVVLLVVDTSFKDDSGFTAGRIALGRKVAGDIILRAKKKKKRLQELIEWGSTKEKISSIAKIKGIKNVALVKQKTAFYKEIIDELKAQGFELNEIKLTEKEEGG